MCTHSKAASEKGINQVLLMEQVMTHYHKQKSNADNDGAIKQW